MTYARAQEYMNTKIAKGCLPYGLKPETLRKALGLKHLQILKSERITLNLTP